VSSPPDAYAVLAAPARATVRDRGSRFLGVVEPAASESVALAVVDALAAEFPDSTHVCWAFRLGAPARERASDAGEPAGTAGQPILRALRAAQLSDAVVAVVRWYGGTNLGRGGLVRAYGAAAREALDAAPRRMAIPTVVLAAAIAPDRSGLVKRLLRPSVELLAETYDPDQARFWLRVAVRQEAALRSALADAGATLLSEAKA
jgi:putative IMPACT (imprinted ancient) family translation regulator